MKVLFLMRHSGYVRNFESTLRLLCERGHTVHLAFQGRVKYAQLDPSDVAAQLASEYPQLTYGPAPIRVDGWGLLGHELRLGVDYLRYLEPEYDDAPKLRERAERTAPPDVLARVKTAPWNTRAGRHAYMAWLRTLNAAIPPDPEIDAFLTGHAPDVLAVTPLIEPGAPQAEFLRSARRLGIRTAYCVASWDNLTNKGLVHGSLDLVTVWNEAMRREAITMHGIAPSRVAVTGAAAFDHWFDWKPSRDRETFCREVGLPADRPYLLYLCSSKFVGPGEAGFVRTWLTALRQAPGRVRKAGVLIRPHPQNAEQWRDGDLRLFAPAVVWPAGEAPVDRRTRNDFFDSIHHSAAVIGLNTTAEIESAIVGRSVYTVLTDNYRGTQDGTLHFRHLTGVNGGVLHVADSLEAHMAQLDAAVSSDGTVDPRLRRFVGAFVRPHGIDIAATPKMVEALERLAASRVASGGDRLWTAALRRRLAPRAAAMAEAAATQPDSLAARLVNQARRAQAAAAVPPGGAPSSRAAALTKHDKGTMKRERHALEQESKERLGRLREEKARMARQKEEGRLRQERNAQTIATFRSMGDRDRRAVILELAGDIPPDCFVDLFAANKPVRLDYPHADIYMQVTTPSEVYRVRACAKEPFTIRWIHDEVAADDVVYDIGANVGAYSLVAARKRGGGARVYSFEASYANIGALYANVALNRADDRVTVVPVALSDTTGLSVFHMRDALPGGARHGLGEISQAEGTTVLQQAVMTFRLDDLVTKLGIPPPHHIKLDVDGGELAVLNGAARTFESPQLRTLLIEVATELSDAVTAAIERSGLRLQVRIIKKNKAGQDSVWYGIFRRGGDPSAPVVTRDYLDTVEA